MGLECKDVVCRSFSECGRFGNLKRAEQVTKTTTDSECGQCRQACQFWPRDLNHAVAELQREDFGPELLVSRYPIQAFCIRTIEVDSDG